MIWKYACADHAGNFLGVDAREFQIEEISDV